MLDFRFFALVLAGLVGLACGDRAAAPARVRFPAPATASPSGTSEARILSAHFALEGAPELGGRDGLIVVFSDPIDPATLVARALLVVTPDGHRVVPERAVLSPAQRGQTRTVLLIGDFTREGPRPSDVIVVGSLFTEGGTSLRGFSQLVDPPDRPDRVVLAHRLPGDGQRCGGAPQVVRTYWSDRLGASGEPDLARARVWLEDGSQLTPLGLEIAPVGDNPDRASNVLDLCVGNELSVTHLRIDPGAFQDTSGHPSAEVDLPVSDPPVAPR